MASIRFAYLVILLSTLPLALQTSAAAAEESKPEQVLPDFSKPRHAGKDLTVTLGASNFGPGSSREAIESFYKSASVERWKSFGITSWESYVRWSGFEPEQGRWDFSMYDIECEILEKHGIRWVPFLLIGMNYATPDWYQKSEKNVYYECLEHGERSGVQSIWNPDLPSQVDRVINAFAEHYRDRGIIESVLLGITGDFGEAIYPVSGGGWTGDYHTHQGYWCGDPYARADFQKWLASKYESPEKLSKSWGKKYSHFEEISPFLQKDAPSERAWLDFVAWYRDSMNQWIDLWMQTTRRAFPNTFIYLCTGGHAPPSHGSHFGEQARLSAKYNGGIRITNEASNYAHNFWLTRWVASAGTFYGAPYSFEPAGPVDVNGITRRIYGVTASSARGLFEYYPNVYSEPARSKQFYETIEFFQPYKRCVDTAVLIPDTWLTIHGDKAYGPFFDSLKPLRDRMDFDFVDEAMLARGAADQYRVLIIASATVFENSTFQQLMDYAERGGIVVAMDDGELRTPQGGDPQVLPALFSASENGNAGCKIIGKGGTIRLAESYDVEDAARRESVLDALCSVVFKPGHKLPNAPAGPCVDGQSDGIYITLTQDALLLLNTTDEKVTIQPSWTADEVSRFKLKARNLDQVTIPPQSAIKVSL